MRASPVVTSAPASYRSYTAAASQAASLEATYGGSLVSRPVARHERDIGGQPRSASMDFAASLATRARNAAGAHAQPVGRYEAASSFTALPLSSGLATNDGWSHCVDGQEISKGNRFASSVRCSVCGFPSAVSIYVSTPLDDSWCGDCWDAYLGVTLVVASHGGLYAAEGVWGRIYRDELSVDRQPYQGVSRVPSALFEPSEIDQGVSRMLNAIFEPLRNNRKVYQEC